MTRGTPYSLPIPWHQGNTRKSQASSHVAHFSFTLFIHEAEYLYSLQRPLLIVYDRGMDLTTPLHHTWTYQALAHDVLDLNLNQIKFSDDAPAQGTSRHVPKSRSHDLDDRKDFFWSTHRGSPFPTTAEAIQAELEEYRKSEEDVKKLKSTMVS